MSETPTTSQNKRKRIEYISSSSDEEDEDKRTLFCANLHEDVTEELLFELFLQAGPLECVKIPKDKDGRLRNFGFVTYRYSCSIPYALNIYEGVSLFRQKMVIRRRNANNSSNSQRSSPHDAERYRGRDREHESRDDRGRDYNSLRGAPNARSSPNLGMQPSYSYGRADRMNPPNAIDLFDPALIAKLTQQVMFGNAGSYDNSYRGVSNRNDEEIYKRSSHANRPHHNSNPYSRSDNTRSRHGDRNDRRSEQRSSGRKHR